MSKVNYLAIDSRSFSINVDTIIERCGIVERAITRYKDDLIFDDIKPVDRDDPNAKDRQKLADLRMLEVNQRSESEFSCQSVPHDDMDESYDLDVVILTDKKVRAELRANSSWGILRGLETFSQLVFNIKPNVYGIHPVVITDNPRFKYRGYMLDTARHYISMFKITNLLDAMAFNKMNVFHWHMVDDQSFPYASSTYSNLSKTTSYRPNMVYTKKDVEFVISYAAERGIRVIPELDTPGHTYSLRSIQNLLTECYDTYTNKSNGNLGPIDPTRHEAYRSVEKLISELSTLFPDSYFHSGGDEVDYDCWKSNPQITSWMKNRDISGNYRELTRIYIRQMYDFLTRLNKTMLVWEDVFDIGVNLPKDTVVQVWKNENDPREFMKVLENVVKSGYKAILSSCWYLNLIDYGQDWVKFYKCDPISEPIRKQDEYLVLGGEVCMWTEFVDDTNVLTRTWPRTSAAAERLWSRKETVDVNEFLERLEQMRCRLLSRGIQAEPVNGPGYC